MTDDEIFEQIYKALDHWGNRIGEKLTEYDWRELSELRYLIEQRGGPYIEARRQEIIDWNLEHTNGPYNINDDENIDKELL